MQRSRKIKIRNSSGKNIIKTYAMGDICQQKLESSNKKYNASRTLLMASSFGLTSGILCHYCPILILTCLSVAGLIERKKLDSFWSHISEKGVKLYIAEWFVWPPAQFVNFYFLPTRYRVAYDNLISLGYTTDIYPKASSNQGMGCFLIGENHMDPQRLSLQQRILEKVSCPELTLSLEFWDRSSQPVIHEYLSNLIDEDIFLRDSNPPENYTDYMGLIRHY
ncbi:MPV17 [Lepeophtheirus salmonis]|uniref:MPV17 n=1 Tax=Lepeophtheirus salmonis TaxID=72036 RepID=A0A7R8H0E3_LEPSM|nr:MPV17 [Lepeophtheirus salmonis]CAF2768596.1 MPV17 [Lepeophtheirus salmonis]